MSKFQPTRPRARGRLLDRLASAWSSARTLPALDPSAAVYHSRSPIEQLVVTAPLLPPLAKPPGSLRKGGVRPLSPVQMPTMKRMKTISKLAECLGTVTQGLAFPIPSIGDRFP